MQYHEISYEEKQGRPIVSTITMQSTDKAHR